MRETRILPPIAQTALRLQIDANLKALDVVAKQALESAGLDETWQIDESLQAVRDIPDPPSA